MGLSKPISKPRKALLAGLVLFCCMAGCERGNQEPAPSPHAPSQAQGTTYTYTVRGQIATLPEPGKPLSALMIRHEPIPDFRDREGNVVGMPAMTMEFSPAEGLSLEGFAPGDKVEVVWEVTVEPRPEGPGPRTRLRAAVTRITKLPPDTELRFGH